ncbi:MAG: alpha/beta hydrolase fold domain-containing protein [Clostridium sp.]|nr:alpha/beta hydrolase fold domain-containing protein [Clostridium sp.]
MAGDSAGAAIAACLINICEKEQLVPPCGQMLIYPVTDATLSSESMKVYVDTPLWNAVNNQKMWKYYLKGKNEQERIKASPLDNELPGKVPKTYIETAEYDCLHDEGIAYANKLKLMGTSVILNETHGTFHGYDSCLNAKISRTNVKKRIDFIKNLISER